MTAIPSNLPHTNSPDAPGSAVELRGSVAGVEACRLLTDRTRFVVGSHPDCDLVVRDPLVPPRAFVIRLELERAGIGARLGDHWVLEATPATGARVFVNRALVHRAPLRLGDEIAIGCHRFEFTGGVTGRASRSETRVDDLLSRMLTSIAPPAGFLAGLPSWRDRLRGRRAWIVGIIMGLLLVLPFVLPREEHFEQVQPPIEVVISETEVLPAIRSLSDVQRKTLDEAQPIQQPAELQPGQVTPMKELAPEPIEVKPVPSAPPPAPTLAKITPEAGPQLAPLAVAPPSAARLEMQRENETLTRSAPQRRLTREEAAQPSATAELARMDIKTDHAMKVPDTSLRHAQEVARQRVADPTPAVTNTRTQAIADLAAFKPSPIKFEEYQGNRIPVARVAETLEQAALPTGAQGIVLDGKITEGETALSWKSGRFRQHGPGDPPEANPATYCYVGKSDQNGRKCLYISFLCADPNTDQLIANFSQNITGNVDAAGIIADDTVEIFLDVNADRNDYHQLIVNARGFYWAGYYATPTGMLENRFKPWSVSPIVKTTINKAAGNWVCEIAIPFDQLGGEPAKGSRWTVNFCRNFRGQKADHQLQTWFLVYDQARNYHHPALFGVFQW